MYGAVHTKQDKAEDIGPNIVPVSVFVIMVGAGGREGGGEGGGRGALTNVSRAVWGSSGYQGAAGTHSVVFCS